MSSIEKEDAQFWNYKYTKLYFFAWFFGGMFAGFIIILILSYWVLK